MFPCEPLFLIVRRIKLPRLWGNPNEVRVAIAERVCCCHRDERPWQLAEPPPSCPTFSSRTFSVDHRSNLVCLFTLALISGPAEPKHWP